MTSNPSPPELKFNRWDVLLAAAVLLLVLLFLGLMRVTAGTYSAFIYFQF